MSESKPCTFVKKPFLHANIAKKYIQLYYIVHWVHLVLAIKYRVVHQGLHYLLLTSKQKFLQSIVSCQENVVYNLMDHPVV